MRNLIVFDHPYTAAACNNEPHNRSFCAALCKQATEVLTEKGDEVDLIDLHADGFNPVMSAEELALWRKGEPMNERVADYQNRIRKADRIIFIFPIWWELMPAMTKGFLDKVYAKNVLYNQPKDDPMSTNLSKDTEIVVITCMGTPTGIYKTVFGKPVIKAMQLGTFRKTGLKNFKWIPYSNVDKLTLEQRTELLSKLEI